ncbi:MAG: DUF167 domain-containing protein [Tepidisphaeraceae bacterium]
MGVKLTADDSRGGVRILLKVVPGASRDRIVGTLGDALKVAVSKPPEAGAANSAVVALLAEALGVSARQVEVVRGHGNPRKEVLVMGASLSELRRRLDDLIKSR